MNLCDLRLDGNGEVGAAAGWGCTCELDVGMSCDLASVNVSDHDGGVGGAGEEEQL